MNAPGTVTQVRPKCERQRARQPGNDVEVTCRRVDKTLAAVARSKVTAIDADCDGDADNADAEAEDADRSSNCDRWREGNRVSDGRGN